MSRDGSVWDSMIEFVVLSNMRTNFLSQWLWVRLPALVLGGCVAVIAPAARAQSTPPAVTLQSLHYHVVAHIDPDLAKKLAKHIDAVYEEYDRRFKSFPVRNAKAFPLFLFERHQDYLDFFKSIGMNASNSGGMFFRTAKEDGLATFVGGHSMREVEQTLQHEGFHQFAYARIAKDLPSWVNEGIAQYFEVAYLARGHLVTGITDADHLLRVQRAIRDDKLLPLEALLTMNAREWSSRLTSGDDMARTMYDQSWSLVHFLIESGSGRADLLEKYLRALSRGTRNADAFKECFGKGTADFEKAWKKYTLELEPDPVGTAASRLAFLAVGLKFLHEKGVEVSTIDELKAELRKVGFKARRVGDAGVEVFSAADDANFTLPTPKGSVDGAKGKKLPSLILVASKNAKLPPSIASEGLKVKVRVNWRIDKAGALVDEMVFE